MSIVYNIVFSFLNSNPPPINVWILETGVWNDAGLWMDTATWND